MVTVGVDLGGSYVRTVVLSDDDEVVGSARMKTPPSGDRATVMDVMDAAVHSALDDAGLGLDDADAIGVGTPGVVIDGTVGGATNVPGWFERFSLAEGFSGKVDRHVAVTNDVTAAAIAEHRLGAGRGAQDVLVVFVGDGVGGGLILAGEPFHGAFGGAGEFGHTVVELDGEVCPCGRRGCVEAYSGRRALVNAAERAAAAGHETLLFTLAEQRDGDRVTADVVAQALDKGDRLVADLVDGAIDALAAGIASAVNLVDVERVVVGGSLAEALGAMFLRRIQAAMAPHLFLVPSKVDVVPAELGVDAGALGAALLARS